MATKTKATAFHPHDKVELVLGGGGVKGFGHIGLLKAIDELQVAVGHVTGVSIGSAIAAMYTNGIAPDKMTDILYEEVQRLTAALFAGNPRASVYSAWRWVSLVNMEVFYAAIENTHGLKPQPNLRIIAYDLVRRQPVAFEGTDYNLTQAVAASCSIPGLMRPVSIDHKPSLSSFRNIYEGWRGRSRAAVLVDGGIYHPAPVEFCKGPAIISRLGMARGAPRETLRTIDALFHYIELAAYKLIGRYFPDEYHDDHITIRSGKPDVASLTFGLSRQTCQDMVDYGYQITKETLKQPILDGRTPVASPKRKERTTPVTYSEDKELKRKSWQRRKAKNSGAEENRQKRRTSRRGKQGKL